MRKLLVVVAWVGVVSSCKENTDIQTNYTTNSPRVNLFPQEIEQNLNQEISLEQAIALSDKVVLAHQIALVDVSSKERSAKVFYLYKAYNTKTIKENERQIEKEWSKTTDTLSSFYFYSNEVLNFNLQKNDSIYLFLQANHDKKILIEKYNLKYKWLENGVVILK